MSVLLVLLVILPPIDWVVAILLLTLWRMARPASVALRERAVAAAILSLIASIAGVLAWSEIANVDIDGQAAILGLAAALVLVSLPNLYWLGLLVTGRFREVGE